MRISTHNWLILLLLLALSYLPAFAATSADSAQALKAAGHFSGRVMDLDGDPVPEARLFIVPSWGHSTARLSEGGTAVINPIESIGPVRATTDTKGRFAFDAPDMVYMATDGFASRRQGLLVAVADGFAPDWITTWGDNSAYGSHWDPVKGAPLDLQLTPVGVPINGRLLAPDGKPLPDARLRISTILVPEDRDLDAHIERITPKVVGSSKIEIFGTIDYERTLVQPDIIPGLVTDTTTDSDGRFTLTGLGRDWLAVVDVTHPEVVNTGFTVLIRDRPDITIKSVHEEVPTRIIHGAEFTRTLEPGRTVKGLVVDRDTGDPIAGMWVGPLQGYRAGVSGTLYRWRSDDDGRFTITGLPPKLMLDEVVMAVAPPGVPYQTVGEWIVGGEEVVIKCPRGIPFRLKVIDEQGNPVRAEVTYTDVAPNPHYENRVPWNWWGGQQHFWPNAPAARQDDGTYAGFVLPGPGAVLVRTPRSAGSRPACVDPKDYFALSRTDWNSDERWAYGTLDDLSVAKGRVDQKDYAAIVLVNPAPGTKELELTAMVVKDVPRAVNFVDSNDEPVETELYRGRFPYRTSSTTLTGLHPDRTRPLVYVDEKQRLVGSLLASGDGDSPYTVRLQYWAAVIGRLVDGDGKPVSGAIVAITSDDPAERERHQGASSDDEGLFRLEKLIPGNRYSAKIYRGQHNIKGRLYRLFIGEGFQNLSLAPGEIHDLGDLRTHSPCYEEFPLTYDTASAQE